MKKIWIRIVNFFDRLHRKLNLLLNRRELILAEKDKFIEIILNYSPELENNTEKIICESCKRNISLSSISAFQILEDNKLALFCDDPMCHPN